MQPFSFWYECPVCHDEAFFLEFELANPAGMVDVLDIPHLIFWDDGIAKVTNKVRCQRCRGSIRYLDLRSIHRLNLPVMIQK